MDKPYISFETERLFVRSIEEGDKEEYMNLRVETSELSRVYSSFPDFRDKEWEEELNSENEICLAVFVKGTQKLAASGSFQYFNSNTIEFGFDVDKDHRNQGIATELVMGMIKIVHVIFPGRSVMIRTNVSNTACRRVAEKCGGILTGYEPTNAAKVFAELMESFGSEPADNEELIRIRKQMAEFIEENQESACVYCFD